LYKSRFTKFIIALIFSTIFMIPVVIYASHDDSENIFIRDEEDGLEIIKFVAVSETASPYSLIKYRTKGFNLKVIASNGESLAGNLPYSIVGSGTTECRIPIYGPSGIEGHMDGNFSDFIQQNGGILYLDPYFDVLHGINPDSEGCYTSYVVESGVSENLSISETMSYTYGGVSFATHNPDVIEQLRSRQGSVTFHANPVYTPPATPTPTPMPTEPPAPPEPNIPTPPPATPEPTPVPTPSPVPTPTPVPDCNAGIDVSGELRECRKITLSSRSTSVNSSIVEYDWDITAVGGGAQQSSICYEGALDSSSEDIIIKKAGTYRVSLWVRNNKGYTDSTSTTINISEDKPPVAGCSLVSPIYRNPADGNKAAYTITNTSYTQDSDSIGNLKIELFYDADNDGNLAGHSPVVLYNGSNKSSHAHKITTGVGRYGIRMTVTDAIPPGKTIPSLLDPGDYKKGISGIKEFVVDNLAPTANFEIKTKKKAHIVVDVGNCAHDINQIQSSINSILVPAMNSNGIDAEIEVREMDMPSEKFFYLHKYAPNGNLRFSEIRCIDLDTLQEQTVYHVDYHSGDYTYQTITGMVADAYGNIYFVHHVKYDGDHRYYLKRINIKNLSIETLDMVDDGEKYGPFYRGFDGNIYYYYETDYGAKGVKRIVYTEPDDINNGRVSFEYRESLSSHRAVFSGHNGIYPYVLKKYFSYDHLAVFEGSGDYDYLLDLDMKARYLTMDREGDIYFSKINDYIQVKGYYKVDNSTLSMTRVGCSNFDGYPAFDEYSNMYYTYSSRLYKYNLDTGRESVIATEDEPGNYPQLMGVMRNGYILYKRRYDQIFQMYNPVNGSTTSLQNQSAGSMEERSATFHPYKVEHLVELGPSVSSVTWDGNTSNYHVVINDSLFSDVSSDESLGNILTGLMNNSIDFIGIGCTDNRSQIMSLAEKNDGNGVYIDGSSISSAITSLKDRVVYELADSQQVIEDNILAGQELEVETFYDDFENDSIHSSRWSYIHDSQYYDNSLGCIPDSGENRTCPYTVFNLPGLYETLFQARDNPKPDSRFPEYRKWSSSSRMDLYVDRAPVCDFETATVSNGSRYNITAVDTSYDPDHTSRADKGIVCSEFYHKDLTGTSWVSGLPTNLYRSESRLIKLRVQDLEGHFSEKVKHVYVDRYQKPVALFDVHPNPAAVYETAFITDMSFDPEGGDIDEWHWKLKNSGGTTIYSDSSGSPGNTPDITSYGAGTYTLGLRVRAGWYRYSAWYDKTVVVTPDLIPPDISLSPESRDYDNTDVTVNVTASDNYSGISHVNYKWTDCTDKPSGGWSSTTSPDFVRTQSGEGIWYLHAEAFDKAGNSGYTYGGPYKIDKTPPSNEVEYIGGAPYIDGNNIWARKGDMIFFSVEGTDDTDMSRLFLLARDNATNPYRQHRDNGNGYNHNNHSRIRFLDSYTAVNTGQSLKAVFELKVVTGGDYTFEMESICDDQWGNRNGWYDSGMRLKTDNTSPSGTASLSPSDWTNDNVIINFTGTDTGSGVKQVEVPGGGVILGENAIYTASSNGTYNFVVTDNVGNTATVPVNVSNIDKTPPGGNYSLDPSGWTTGNVSINLNAFDTQSGVDRIQKPDGSIVYSDTASYTVSRKGLYGFVVWDRAGNQRQIIADVSNIDHDPPTGVFNPDSFNWTNENVSVTFTAQDTGGSGVDRWMYRHSIDYGNTYGDWSGWTSGSSGIIELLDEGYHVLHAQIEDNSGNIGNTHSGVYLIDKTPAMFLYAMASGETYKDGNTYWIAENEDLDVSIRGFDAMSNIMYSYIRIPIGDNRSQHRWDIGNPAHNNEWMTSVYTDIISAQQTYDNNNTREVTWTIKGLDDVTSDIQYYFRDFAGNNIGYVNTGLRIGVDCTPPSAEYTLLSDIYTNEDVLITVNASDDGSGVKRIQLPDGTWCNADFASYFVGSNGNYPFLVEDNVGYQTPLTVSVTTIDTEGPGIDCVPPSMENDDDITVTVTGTDDSAGTGIDYIRYKWTDSTTRPDTNWNIINLDGEMSHSFDTAISPDGTWYLHMEIFDRAGNGFYRYRGPFTITRNRPPSVNIIGIEPGVVYEGDAVSVVFQPDDPDLEPLDVTVELFDSTDTSLYTDSFVISPSGGVYTPVTHEISSSIAYGNNFRVEVTTSDAEDTASDTFTFNVSELSITGYVNHTDLWDENRIKYNQSKTGTDDDPRPYSMFWPGERFCLEADTTEIDPSSSLDVDFVLAEIINTSYSTYLSQTGSSTWEGELWEEEMLSLAPDDYTFRFTVRYTNGTVKTQDVEFEVNNDEPYWRLHRLF